MSEKKRMVEKYIVTPESYHKREGFNEAEEVISVEEGKQKKEYKAKAVYTFPISKPDVENLNERIYSSKLWENVMKKMKSQSTPGLMDHPKDEGSTKDIFCVWRNLRFSEDKKTVVADAYLFGNWGQQVKEYLEAGGLVGLSTSGFGEMEEDSKKVKEDTYDLERVADFVFNPSYEVFGKDEDRVDDEKPVEEKIEESIEEKNEPEVIPEEVIPEVPIEEGKEEIQEDNHELEINKEKKPMSGLEKAGEKSFRLNINSLFKEAKTVEKLGERINAYQELLSYFDEGVAEDLRDQIQTALDTDLQLKEEMAVKGEQADALVEEKASELQTQIEALEKEKETLTKEKEELEINFNNATELLDSMKVYANKLKELYETSKAEKNGMITATEYKEALAFIEELEEEKKKAEQEVVKLRKSLSEDEDEDTEEDEDEDEDEEDDVAEKKKKKKKEDKDIREEYASVSEEIISYYEDLEYHEPLVIKIKDDILRCKTLIEAQRTYLRLKSLLKENPEYSRKVVADNKDLYEKREAVRRAGSLKIPKGWM